MLSPNTKLQNRYRIIRHLGQGGMGTVYEAIDERVSCIVAVKETLRGDQGAFKREAELLANLRHPSLPRVTDHFSVDEGSFLVMDFIPGHDLAELLELRGSPFPEEQALGWADELLKALEYLHRREVLHRDIKPSNLKLMRTGEIFLLDFGLAKGAAGQMSTLTTNRSVLGHTLTYASLEQIHGHGTDARSDLYSLGATLYHLLTGVHPVDAPARDLAVDEEHPDPLRPVHELNPQVSPAVSAVIHQAMAIRRKGRPESAAEMSRLLSEASRAVASLAEEEKRRSHEAEETRLRGEAANAAPPVISQPVAAVPPTQKASPPVGASDAPAQMSTLQTPQPAYTQSASPVSAASGTIGRGGGKPKWLLVAAAVVLVLLVVIIVVKMSGTTADNGAHSYTENINGMGLEMELIPSGTFQMGSPDPEVGRGDDEWPQHLVSVQSFYMGKYEVTQAQYRAVMGTNPAYFKGCDQCPVEQVTWNDANEFCRKLSQMTRKEYRLPSEAEWEYACRARTEGPYAGSLAAMAWFYENAGDARLSGEQDYKKLEANNNRTHPVGQKQKNDFGLYDMYGNVSEWCQDWYHANYNGAPTDGSAWLSGGEQKGRVYRGGSWGSHGGDLRSANRYYDDGKKDLVIGSDFPSPSSGSKIGFRVVADARPQ